MNSAASATPLATGDSSSLPPAPATYTIANPYTGDYRMDALLEGLDYRWNHSSAVGSSVSVTYSFPAAAPSYADATDSNGFTAFTSEQQAAVRDIFSLLSQQVGLDFTEVSDSDSSYGQIRFGNNNQGSSSGYAYLPNSNGEGSGDVYIGSEYSTGVTPGAYAYATLVHEIGHALGLKHPGNYNAGEAGSTAPGNYLGVDDDMTVLTIMSYRENAQGLQGVWYAPYDMLTLRYLYGSRSYAAGDTTYTMTDANGQRLNSIVDDGGTDTIDLSGLSSGATLDLTPGRISSLGVTGSGAAASQNLAIATSATIENVVGSAHNDAITLNSASNQVSGGAGIDTVTLSGARSSYTTSASGDTITIAASGATDTLSGVERVVFSDARLAFDLSGSAGNTVRLITAAFGTSNLSPSLTGVGIQLFDQGMDMTTLATAAVGIDLFRQVAGSTSNEDFVTAVYRNVIGSAPDAATQQSFVALLQGSGGTMTQGELLALAANSDVNAQAANLVGLASTGIEYS